MHIQDWWSYSWDVWFCRDLQGSYWIPKSHQQMVDFSSKTHGFQEVSTLESHISCYGCWSGNWWCFDTQGFAVNGSLYCTPTQDGRFSVTHHSTSMLQPGFPEDPVQQPCISYHNECQHCLATLISKCSNLFKPAMHTLTLCWCLCVFGREMWIHLWCCIML